MSYGESTENYLEYLYMCELEGKNEVKSLDIAKYFSYTRAAIAKAMEKLLEEGFINKKYYGTISLTDTGREIGKNIYTKHITLKKFLMKIGVSEKVASVDCCRLEHILSPETYEKIKEFINKND